MSEHHLTFSASASGARALPRIMAAVLKAWPVQAGVPRARQIPLDDLLTELDGPQWDSRAGADAPHVIVLGPTDAETLAYQVADRAHNRLIPATILMPALTETTRKLQSGGVLVAGWEADGAYLAAALFALAERQTTVRALSRDLQIAARYQGGMTGEIDRIHDELNLAASVQREMLPRRLPTMDGLECGVLFRPVGYVSGDIYDVTELDDRRVGFFIADAVGHGVPAALLTMIISKCLRTAQMDHLPGMVTQPGVAMTTLNHELLRGRRESPRFATAIYGVLDTVTREVTMSGAGHPQPLVVSRGKIRKLETDGPLLGVFPGEKYGQVGVTLEPGETLLLYSDGFETAFPTPGAAEHERKRATMLYMQQIAGLPWPEAGAESEGTLADTLNELVARLDEQSGSLHQVDDVTALAISVRRAASAAGAGMETNAGMDCGARAAA